MDYPFENLDPERFQQLCQALVATGYPGLQCFPVGQPDGGRDATAPGPGGENDHVVFQAKFVRNPVSVQEARKSFVATVKDELPRIRELIARGTKQYVLITNLSGTGHPDAGSIDKVNAALAALEVSAVCWWRDDLARRLDNAWNLKWVYPELMTGPDLIRAIIEKGLAGEDQERRAAAIQAFVAYQHQRDEEVRFKQVELQNKVLDLFIDVPARPRRGPSFERQVRTYVEILTSMREKSRRSVYEASTRLAENLLHRDYKQHDEWPAVGAAALILSPEFAQAFPYVVLEGAPGQGKSTVAQYVCQLERMRVRGNRALPMEYQGGPVRLPIKVEIRDLAAWLGRKDPFSSGEEELMEPMWQKSLEGFLAAQICHDSGGTAFDVADLLSVAKVSALLLVLDGLDEVADIARRQEVVEEVTNGVTRLAANAASLQVVVTSRPAAFASSPGLPDDQFAYFELVDVTPELIEEYAEKWIRARQLSSREASDVRTTLREKLDEPHLRDLARNPMQLAILLGLMHTRGTSLPDKRTALYDTYIDVFFNRESEKSPVVRQHRELLLNIHRHLAWLLHSDCGEWA